MTLAGRNILVGLTGGIACYKTPHLVRLLKKAGADVRVMMTESATRFVAPLTLESVAQQPVITDMWPKPGEYVGTRHIDTAEWPDLIVIAPTTANLMAKAAAGLCDDFVTTVICATSKPIVLAPAMNPEMWRHPVTQRNLRYLVDELGWLLIDPDAGEMACDSYGIGRMAEPEAMFDRLADILQQTHAQSDLLAGRHLIVTAGPTREPVDPVRFISNRSSGKMGYALAEAARDAGARVTLISGPTALASPPGVAMENVETTSEMRDAVMRQLSDADVLLMAAAPADFTPAHAVDTKMKKSERPETLPLSAAPDILRSVAETRTRAQVIVGFALETDEGVANARAKRASKDLDMIVLNSLVDEGAGFDFATNKVTLIDRSDQEEAWPMLSKREVAKRLIKRVATLLSTAAINEPSRP